MGEIIGVDYGELNREVSCTRNSVNNMNPLEYGSDIGADQFERLRELHDDLVGLTGTFASVIVNDLNAIQRIGGNIVDTDDQMSTALSGMMNTGGE